MSNATNVIAKVGELVKFETESKIVDDICRTIKPVLIPSAKRVLHIIVDVTIRWV